MNHRYDCNCYDCNPLFHDGDNWRLLSAGLGLDDSPSDLYRKGSQFDLGSYQSLLPYLGDLDTTQQHAFKAGFLDSFLKTLDDD